MDSGETFNTLNFETAMGKDAAQSIEEIPYEEHAM